MPTYQTGKNVSVAFKSEGASYGVPPGASGAKYFRPTEGGGGLNLTKQTIASREVRQDAQRTRGRHSIRAVAGGYPAELSLTTFDDLLEALWRGTWAASLQATQADVTSVTVVGNAYRAASGSWLTKGFRAGDVLTVAGLPDAANNGLKRAIAVSAQDLTVAETLTAMGSPDSSFTITRGKKLVNPGALAQVRKSFSFEERNIDIDGTELYTGIRVSTLRLQMQPNGMVTLEWQLVGQDLQVLLGASSPYYTAPTLTTSLPMTAADAKLRIGTTDVADLTGLDLTFTLGARGQDVIAALVTPDVFEASFEVAGSATALVADLQRLQDFVAETPFDVSLLCKDANGVDYINFFLGNATLGGHTKQNFGADGPRTASTPLIIGIDDAGGADTDATTCKIITSGP